MTNKKEKQVCNTCGCVIGESEYCDWPSLKNLYFLGDESKNSICCENCQQECIDLVEEDN